MPVLILLCELVHLTTTMPRNDILDDFDFDENPFLEDAGDGEVVAKFYSAMEAEMAAARLRSEGIPCFIANSMSQSILTNMQLLVRLHVRPQDFDHARVILAEAAVDAELPIADKSTDRLIIIFLTALILLILILLLVQSIGTR